MSEEEEELYWEKCRQEEEFKEAQRQYAEDMGITYPTWDN